MTGFQSGNVRKRTTGRIVAAGVAVATLPLILTGCWNGFDAQTSSQQPSGDGLNTQVGNIQVRSAVWVRDAKNPTTFTLSATFVNTGKTTDSLTAVTTVPKAFVVGITDGAITLEPISETRTAFNSSTYVNAFGMNTVPPSGYVDTTFVFKNAGSVTGSVIVVPPEGIYEGIQPSLSTQSASAKPSTSASSSNSATPSASSTR